MRELAVDEHAGDGDAIDLAQAQHGLGRQPLWQVDEGHRRERHARGPQGALGALNLITRLVEPFGGPGLSLLDGGVGVDEIVSGILPGPVQGVQAREPSLRPLYLLELRKLHSRSIDLAHAPADEGQCLLAQRAQAPPRLGSETFLQLPQGNRLIRQDSRPFCTLTRGGVLDQRL